MTQHANASLLDPVSLVKQATAFLEDNTPLPVPPEIKESLQRAERLVSADVVAIDQARQRKSEFSYSSLLGPKLPEKIAALTYLTRFKLIDVHFSAQQSTREIAASRRELTIAFETLFHVQAADALGLLYEFAASQHGTGDLKFWEGVCQRCLHLMALLRESCPTTVLTFLRDRSDVRRDIERFMQSSDPALATAFRALGEDYVRARRTNQLAQMTPLPAPFLTMYRAFDQRQPEVSMAGAASFLAAQERILRAIADGDFAALSTWLAEGSPMVAQSVLVTARTTFIPTRYIAFLEYLLAEGQSSPVYLTAAVQELGALNQGACPEGGDQEINRILMATAMTREAQLAGVARVAVQQLGLVNDFNDVLQTLNAMILEVAEEAVNVLFELRRLPMVESFVRNRPSLQAAYQAAKQQMQEIQSLMESAWSAQSDDLMMLYLTRLKERNAVPELQQLCQRKTRVSQLAKRTLTELQVNATAPG